MIIYHSHNRQQFSSQPAYRLPTVCFCLLVMSIFRIPRAVKWLCVRVSVFIFRILLFLLFSFHIAGAFSEKRVMEMWLCGGTWLSEWILVTLYGLGNSMPWLGTCHLHRKLTWLDKTDFSFIVKPVSVSLANGMSVELHYFDLTSKCAFWSWFDMFISNSFVLACFEAMWTVGTAGWFN